jgi:DNA-directed RNA polymerase specialized sigma24 family protein
MIRPVPYPGGDSVAGVSGMLERNSDQEILELLKAEEFSGPVYRAFGERLAHYGLPVIRNWITTGEIFRRSAEMGRPLKRSDTRMSYEDIQDLTNETTARGLIRWTSALRNEKWEAGRGASLKTYFVGACIQEFPNVYRIWARQNRYQGVLSYDEIPEVADYNTPERQVVEEMVPQELIGDATPFDSEILRMIGHGYSQREIAAALDVTERAVEGRIYRLRRRFLRSE